MMEACIGDADPNGRLGLVYVHLAEEKLSAVQQSERIPARAIAEELRPQARRQGNGRSTGSLDPAFNREILQLEVRRIAHQDAVAGAVEHKSLTDLAGRIGRVAHERPAISIREVNGTAFGRPPTARSEEHT